MEKIARQKSLNSPQNSKTKPVGYVNFDYGLESRAGGHCPKIPLDWTCFSFTP